MATNFVEKWQTPLIRHYGIPKRKGISLSINVSLLQLHTSPCLSDIRGGNIPSETSFASFKSKVCRRLAVIW